MIAPSAAFAAAPSVVAAPWLRAAGVAAAIALLLFAARRWQARRSPAPELVRKLVHVGVGVIACSLPWLFGTEAPVLALCGAAFATMVALRVVPRLRAGVGQTLHAVPRRSTGELCFVAAIAVLWLLVSDRPAIYVASLLVLALADAAAALVGRRMGSRRYATDDGLKSIEGSMAFVVVAFAVVTACMLADGSTAGRAILMGAAAALLLMVVEAIAWRGVDNFFVPIVASVLLVRWAELDVAALVGRLVAALVLVGAAIAWRRRTTLIDSAAMAGGLFLYAAWAIGGWPWLVAPALLLAAQPWILGRAALARMREHGVAAVLAAGGAGFAWLIIYATKGNVESIIPYAMSFGAAAVMLATVSIGYHRPPPAELAAQVAAAIAIAAIAVTVAIAALPGTFVASPGTMAALMALVVAAAIASSFVPVAHGDDPAGWRWLARGGIVGASSVAAWFMFRESGVP